MSTTINRNPLGKVYRLAWRDENPKVRLAALFLLTKGQVRVEHFGNDGMLMIEALRDAGCEYDISRSSNSVGCNFVDTYTFTCDGAKMCYENGAFYE